MAILCWVTDCSALGMSAGCALGLLSAWPDTQAAELQMKDNARVSSIRILFMPTLHYGEYMTGNLAFEPHILRARCFSRARSIAIGSIGVGPEQTVLIQLDTVVLGPNM